MMFDRLWIKKQKVLFNMIIKFITFSLKYCTHLRAFLSPIFLEPKETEIILEAKLQDIFLNRIQKRGSDKNLENFLKALQKISNREKTINQRF